MTNRTIIDIFVPLMFKCAKNTFSEIANGTIQVHIVKGYITLEKRNAFCYKIKLSKIKESVSSLVSI
ncbi:MAG: hypothetical protein LUH47_02875 [Clostridiales bacterium]|nr:hypothetical protein [Clostridiales bacterium]